MQTFLPYKTFQKSVQVLDNKRLGKQRVEAFQILNVLQGNPTKTGRPYKGWLNHPCVTLWKGFEESLMDYYNHCIEEWINRGFKNTMPLFDVRDPQKPDWVGFEPFHSSHRANLLRKDPEYYAKFGWCEDPEDPYLWLDKKNKWYKQISGTKEIEYLS